MNTGHILKVPSSRHQRPSNVLRNVPNYEKENFDAVSLQERLVMNRGRGVLSELLAKNDFEGDGFIVSRTGMGSDFFARKNNDTQNLEYLVEVKAGTSRLTKFQRRIKYGCSKSGYKYRIYRVNDLFLSEVPTTIIKLFSRLDASKCFLRVSERTKCPHCEKIANGFIEICRTFGLRNVRRYIIVQSWCKDCRSGRYGA